MQLQLCVSASHGAGRDASTTTRFGPRRQAWPTDARDADQRTVPDDILPNVIEAMDKGGLDVSLYRETDWFVRKKDAPHVDREAWTVKFPPKSMGSCSALCWIFARSALAAVERPQ